MSDINPRIYDALGDGHANDTVALQKSIDACHDSGGGRVVVDSGVYMSGTLFLKSNVELHLLTGAIIRGLADRDAYNPDDIFPENEVFTVENTTGAHLIIAYKAENIAITGGGTIDGNSSAFFEDLPKEKKTEGYLYKNCNLPIGDWRPSQMIFFCRCKNVRARDVSLINSPYWTFFLLGCRDVRVDGLLIENHPQTQNGDGIDIDCCQDVCVSNCIIRSGDDSITLRANERPLGETMPCRNITITNCILQSPCNAIRVGVGDGTIEDCLFNNIIIKESRTGINMVCRYGDFFQRGTVIRRIRFSNFRMNCVLPLHLYTGPGAVDPVAISDVDFHGFYVLARAGSYLGGEPDAALQHISFRDWLVNVEGGTDNLAFTESVPDPFSLYGAPGLNNTPALPAVFFIRNAEDISIKDFEIRWSDSVSAVWKEPISIDQVKNLNTKDLIDGK